MQYGGQRLTGCTFTVILSSTLAHNWSRSKAFTCSLVISVLGACASSRGIVVLITPSTGQDGKR